MAMEPGPEHPAEQHERGMRSMYAAGVLLMAALSSVILLAAMYLVALVGLCYDGGSTARAARCATGAVAFLVAAIVAASVPIAFGVWGRRVSNRAALGRRLGLCAVGYLPVLVAALMVAAG